MATISTGNGRLLARPTGGVLATDCVSSEPHCSPCITHDQADAALAIAGGCLSNPWEVSGLIQMAPATLYWCEAWEGPTWAGNCCWVWANYVDISDEVGVPGWIFNWVLIVNYNSATGLYDATIYVGSGFDDGDPCTWTIGNDPAFTATDIAASQAANPSHYIECGPGGQLSATFEMTGQDSGYGGGDATGCTATVTI